MSSPAASAPAPREDVFVSLCVPEAPVTPGDVERIVAVATAVAKVFRYYEVLIIADLDAPDDLLRHCLLRCPNLRVLRVRGSSQLYASRVVAAREAIGDVVIITALVEIGALDLIDLATTAIERNAIAVFTRTEPVSARHGLSDRLLAVLGAASRFRISTSDLRTLAIPRGWVARLLAHPQAHLALRFPPLGEGFPIEHIAVADIPALRLADAAFRRRLALVYALAIHAAPTLIVGVGVLSLLVMAGGVLFMLYAIGALFLVKHLQEGWFTTSLVQAGIACYLGLAILGLSLGLQKVLANGAARLDDQVVDETNNTDLFSDIRQLNIAVELEAGGRGGDPASPT